MTTLSDRATAILAKIGDREKERKQDGGPSVAALLASSRDQHLIYRRAVKHAVAGRIVAGDPVAADAAFRETARLRAEAELADPEHTDPAWGADAAAKFPHDALLKWYEEQLV